MIVTSQIINNPKKVMNELMYQSYKANRGYGMTHEAAVRIGIGNDEFKARYEFTKDPNNLGGTGHGDISHSDADSGL